MIVLLSLLSSFSISYIKVKISFLRYKYTHKKPHFNKVWLSLVSCIFHWPHDYFRIYTFCLTPLLFILVSLLQWETQTIRSADSLNFPPSNLKSICVLNILVFLLSFYNGLGWCTHLLCWISLLFLHQEPCAISYYLIPVYMQLHFDVFLSAIKQAKIPTKYL